VIYGDQLTSPLPAVMLARFDPDGVLTHPPFRIAEASERLEEPRVVFDGERLWATWQRALPGGPQIAELVRVQPDGVVEDLAPMTVPVSGPSHHSPGMGSDGAGRTLYAYVSYDPAIPSSARLHYRMLTVLPLDAPCSQSAQCGSGLCVRQQCRLSGDHLGVGCGCSGPVGAARTAPLWLAGLFWAWRARRR
jgi:hypothetical protein